MEFKKRLAEARIQNGLNKSELARHLGISASSCIQWESEDNKRPNIRNMEKLAILLDVNFEWLATGRGPREYAPQISEPSANYARLINEGEKQILQCFRALPEKKRQALLILLDDSKTGAAMSNPEPVQTG